MYNKKSLLFVVGPTASGKTELAIHLAKRYNTEIISADSRQVYKDLKIGTAQPTRHEQQLVKHHLIDFIPVGTLYTVSDYVNDANSIITQLLSEREVVIICGGTGLYINSLVYGINDIPPISSDIRSHLREEYKNYGLRYICDKLITLDNYCEDYLDMNNPHRVLRALEVITQTGKPLRYFFSQKDIRHDYECKFMYITRPQEELYKRIDTRVDKMIQQGLIEEVKAFKQFKNCNALKTIGYKEIIKYLDGEISLAEAIEEIKINTHHYAKRQITWFKKLHHNNHEKFITSL
ncbi:MAG: tRNA (adenosine(37)-N6)-dimethylallyltransferase MiaA [Cytophagales bacterium]|nr:tRNA (adenosine(37)-N6)-dimethylallyltransferase MiaA [Cytophagales bacterium]